MDTTEKLNTLSPPDGQVCCLTNNQDAVARINGEACPQVDEEGFGIWQTDWGLIAFSLSGRWFHP